jgi:LAS superfamily LD-carboxypeptidase LdcB
MEKLHEAVSKIPIITLALVLSIGGVGVLGYENFMLKQAKQALEAHVSSLNATQDDLRKNIATLDNALASSTDERNGLLVELNSEKAMVEALGGQVKNISSDVGTLVKLSKTDPELLAKYSKVYFLSENYIPPKLTLIDTKYGYNQKQQYFEGDAWPFLQKLLDSASSSNVDVKIISAYRSFDEQSGLKNSYKFTYGAGTANQFSADQGYSEHQLGTAIDFTNSALGSSFSPFDKATAYTWLMDNAYKYGFILSYPKNNGYYIYEPWHWRFVGKALAEKLFYEKKRFYDLDQREIDTYLVKIFD